jgi:hypothetical protein
MIAERRSETQDTEREERSAEKKKGKKRCPSGFLM